MAATKSFRHLYVVLGDQLDLQSSFFDEFDKSKDIVWMAEVLEESERVWVHKARIVLFLSAMRHFRDELRSSGYKVFYHELAESNNFNSFPEALRAFLDTNPCEEIRLRKPGEYRLISSFNDLAKSKKINIQIVEDSHFLSTDKEFGDHAAQRKQLRMEYFYREMRVKHSILMDGQKPVGGEWNFDAENRKSFPKTGPGLLPAPLSFKPDKITKKVMGLVQKLFSKHPGKIDSFPWPVDRKQALAALDDFLKNRLPFFGDHQDAMWTNQPWLYHSLIASSLNLHLLHPLEVIRGAEKEFREGNAPLAAVEGFIRQILGWREYVRGIYWLLMPDYLGRNSLNACEKLPDFFWTGETDLNCLKCAIGQTLEYGYAHHIQRLMVTGLFCLLYGVDPKQVHEWYLAVYVDAVEWVELPNSLGMSQYADGGVMASKPYIASGSYINRMSNYCKTCKFDPSQSVGENACPITTMYWDFLIRHEKMLSKNPRMGMQVRNLSRFENSDRALIRRQADKFRKSLKVL